MWRLATRRLLPTGRLAPSATRTLVTGTPYGEITIGVPKETTALERRVAQTPESIAKLTKEGFQVYLIGADAIRHWPNTVAALDKPEKAE